MGRAALGLVIIFVAVGCVLGWHANRARSAHGDVRTTRNRLPGYRKARNRSGLIALGMAVALLLVFADILRG